MEPMVYIVLVNYNGIEDTEDCIRSLLNIQYNNYKIVVVENASQDAELMKQNTYINENAIVLYSQENGGFSAGNNIGIQLALEDGADYVLLLNNDTTVEPDFLAELVKVAQEDKEIGIVTGNIYYYTAPETLWYSCGKYDYETGITHMCNPCLREKCEVNFVCGCLLLLKVKMIKDIGVLDDQFFLYSEDTEYTCRALNAGWKAIWTSKAKIYHKVSASTQNNSCFQKYYLIRNNLFMARKYCKKPIKAGIIRIYIEMRDCFKGTSSFRAIVYAVIDFLGNRMGKTKRFMK